MEHDKNQTDNKGISQKKLQSLIDKWGKLLDNSNTDGKIPDMLLIPSQEKQLPPK